MKRQRKTNQGFTLVELLIVIVIIGILAAVIIPNVANNIEKGRIASDVSDVRNMNTILSTYCLSNGIDATKLEAPEVRAIVSSEEKNFTFAPKGTQSTFWYNKNEGKIELAQQPLITPGGTSGSRLDSVYADFTPGSIEELVSGYLYLNTKDKTNVANLLFQFRNLKNANDYASIANSVSNLPQGVRNQVSNVVKEFDISNTVFVGSEGAATRSGVVKHVVFAEGLKVIPHNALGIVNHITEGSTIRIPSTVEVVMPGAFTDVLSASKIELAKPATKVLEGALSESIKAASSVSETKINNNRIKEGNRLITVTIKGTLWESGNKKDHEHSGTPACLYDSTNGITFGHSKLDNPTETDGIVETLNYIEIENYAGIFRSTINATVIDEKYEYTKNKKTERDYVSLHANKDGVKINIAEFFKVFPNVNSLTVIYTSRSNRIYDLTVMAFDNSGMVLNLLISVQEANSN